MGEKRSKFRFLRKYQTISNGNIWKFVVRVFALILALFYVGIWRLQEQKHFKLHFCVFEGSRNMKFGMLVSLWYKKNNKQNRMKIRKKCENHESVLKIIHKKYRTDFKSCKNDADKPFSNIILYRLQIWKKWCTREWYSMPFFVLLKGLGAWNLVRYLHTICTFSLRTFL